jgi:hypothetical protein
MYTFSAGSLHSTNVKLMRNIWILHDNQWHKYALRNAEILLATSLGTVMDKSWEFHSIIGLDVSPLLQLSCESEWKNLSVQQGQIPILPYLTVDWLIWT